MLALSPPLFSNNNIGFYWPLEDANLGLEDQNYFYGDIEVGNSLAQESGFPDHFVVPPPSDCSNQRSQAEVDCTPTQSTTGTPITSNNISMAVKKLNHNASERDRRKKINHMYISLRALLPASDHAKKLSIPATVSRVIKYIPELQKQVEGLIQKQEELLLRINSNQQGNHQIKQEISNTRAKTASWSTLSSVSASQLNDKEASVQISTHKNDKMSLSEMVRNLEKDGLSVLSASSFESFGERLFHNLHLQVEGSCGVEYGTLGEKLMSLSSDIKELYYETKLL